MSGMERYIARVSDRAGRKLYETAALLTRAEAAAAAFEAKPKARSCSTARAVYVENLGAWRSYGMDIRWHDRHEVAASVEVAAVTGRAA